jgi:hypothetical protein
LGSILSVGVSSSRRRDRCDGHCERGGRGWRRHRSGRRTRYNATVLERLSPRIRVIDPTHPFFGQLLEVSASRPSRRTGWIQVVLPDGRHRWIPQKATDLEDVACEITPNRDLPLVFAAELNINCRSGAPARPSGVFVLSPKAKPTSVDILLRKPEGSLGGGTDGSQTRRWREMDSNYRFRATAVGRPTQARWLLFANRAVTCGRFRRATIKHGTPIELPPLMVVDTTVRIAVNWAMRFGPVSD